MAGALTATTVPRPSRRILEARGTVEAGSLSARGLGRATVGIGVARPAEAGHGSRGRGLNSAGNPLMREADASVFTQVVVATDAVGVVSENRPIIICN